MTKHCRLQ